MRIKSLQINGFKSFADAANLTFGDGITGVVGPNGCGKSNIIDAIRWVMGEMSAKNLRGRAMQDVIFAGSETRGPSGLAEVTLTLRNDGNVPPAYAAYGEIAVTRRLHRDNTSEYLINKTPCRLRDITDLFLGTGVGTRAYSIIEQGRIGFIVSARPEDRRTLIEEVAGITKFKARRKAAERRMEATEQNLARVNDIITELERQLGSLRRQAKKAARYKRVKDELLDVDLHLATIALFEFRAREKVQQGERDRLDAQHGDTIRAVEAEEARVESERLRQLEDEQRLQVEQGQSAELESRLAALERDLSHWRSQLNETRLRVAAAREDVESSKARAVGVSEERVTLVTAVEQMRQRLVGDRADIGAAAAEVEQLQAGIGQIDGDLDAKRKEALEWVQEVARHHGLTSSLEVQRVDLTERRRRAICDHESTRAQCDAAEGRQGELQQKRDRTAQELATWQVRRKELTAEAEQLIARVSASETHVLDLRAELAESGSRLESLEEISRRLEGYSEGVRTLMASEPQRKAPAKVVDGIVGLVSDGLSTEPRYERAIEGALGERLQLLVVEEQQVGVEGIGYLRSRDGGRSGFIPRQPRRVAQPRRTGGVASALDVVRVAQGYEAVAEYLLGDVLIVESLAAGLALWRDAEVSGTYVTLDGEVIDAGGILSGGSVDGGGLLAKGREIRELRAAVALTRGALEEASASHDELDAQRLQLDVDIQQLDKEIRQAELEQLETTKDLEVVAAEIQRLRERGELLDHEIAQYVEELARIATEAQEAQAAAADAEAHRVELEQQIATLQQRRAQAGADVEQRVANLTELRIALASRDEKLAGSSAAIERLDYAGSEYDERISRALQTISEGQATIVDLTQRIGDGEGLATTTAAEVQQRRRQLSEARAVYETERQRLGEIDHEMRERRRGIDIVREALVELKMDLQRLDLERAQLFERVAERHDVDLLRVAGDYHMRPLPTATDHERKAQLERSLKNMGSINLTAIDECEEVEKRFTFLATQRDDLTAALDSLRRAIQRINRTSRQRFRDAYDAVNAMFQEVFPRLFRGGEARLELMDHDDVLEAGVDIVAQPPGKKLQNLTLLSGGEKALTATALVFAIFLVKPSPFCVLDEVDAPLDDSNVNRFNEMLREIAKISQFIVITHNKLTMTEADRLYGITMEEPGMTKLVAVDLDSAGGSDGDSDDDSDDGNDDAEQAA